MQLFKFIMTFTSQLHKVNNMTSHLFEIYIMD